MSEYAPVAVLEPARRRSRCLGAYRIVLADLETSPSVDPYPYPRRQRRDPKALAKRIWAEELGFGEEAP